jgi:hypothetical protein
MINEGWRDDGIINWHDGEYRIHKAWTDRPHVFVRYFAHGRLCERKLPRDGTTAIMVTTKFRNIVRWEQNALAPLPPVC